MQISDSSISGDPLSLYVSDHSINPLFLNYINVKAIQSYYLHESLEDSDFGNYVYEADSITISEDVTVTVVGP